MIQTIRQFFTNVRCAVFHHLLDWEIYQRIAPQVHKEKDCGYPFHSREELIKLNIRLELDTKLNTATLEKQIATMPKAYGEAFRYLVYRDLNEHTVIYRKLAQSRVPRPSQVEPVAA